MSHRFGTAATEVLALTKDNPRLKACIFEDSPSVPAEVVSGVREEMATSIEDILARRTGLQLSSWEQATAPAVGASMALEFGWSPGQQTRGRGICVNKISGPMQLMVTI